MSTVTQFITYAAWLLLLLCIMRVLALLFMPMDETQEHLVRLAEAYGSHPIASAVLNTCLLAALCGCWLLAYYF